MKKETAVSVLEVITLVSEQLHASVTHVGREEPSGEYAAYRKAIGKVLGTVFVEVLDPIYREHPELTPPGIRRPVK